MSLREEQKHRMRKISNHEIENDEQDSLGPLDIISQKLGRLAKENDILQKNLANYEQMGGEERELLRETARTNSQLTTELNTMLNEYLLFKISFRNERTFIESGEKAKSLKKANDNFLQLLKKETKRLEFITTQLVFMEKDLLNKFKAQQDTEPEERAFLLRPRNTDSNHEETKLNDLEGSQEKVTISGIK